MNHQKNGQLTNDVSRGEPIELIPTAKPTAVETSLRSTTCLVKRKRLRFAALIVSVLLVGIMAVAYLLRYVPAGRLEGLGAALCAIACGGLLVRRLLRGMAEEDKLEEEQRNANQATVSPPEPNPTGLQTNLTAPPEAEENIK